jgi:hypothetical protein
VVCILQLDPASQSFYPFQWPVELWLHQWLNPSMKLEPYDIHLPKAPTSEPCCIVDQAVNMSLWGTLHLN